jgi:hypothetical protein
VIQRLNSYFNNIDITIITGIVIAAGWSVRRLIIYLGYLFRLGK